MRRNVIIANQLAISIQKLRPKANDVLVLSATDTRQEAELLEMAAQIAKVVNHPWSLLLVLAPGTSVRSLDERAMNRHGWFRGTPVSEEDHEPGTPA